MVDRDGLSTRRTVEVRPAVTTDYALPNTSDAPPPRRRSRAHRVPRWAVWMMTAVTVAAAVGTVVTFGLDFQASSEPGAEDRAATMRLVSAVLGGVAGASLGVTMVLIPYAFGPRADRQDTDYEGDTALSWERDVLERRLPLQMSRVLTNGNSGVATNGEHRGLCPLPCWGPGPRTGEGRGWWW